MPFLIFLCSSPLTKGMNRLPFFRDGIPVLKLFSSQRRSTLNSSLMSTFIQLTRNENAQTYQVEVIYLSQYILVTNLHGNVCGRMGELLVRSLGLTFYTLTSVCIFSILFFIHFLRSCQGELA